MLLFCLQAQEILVTQSTASSGQTSQHKDSQTSQHTDQSHTHNERYTQLLLPKIYSKNLHSSQMFLKLSLKT